MTLRGLVFPLIWVSIMAYVYYYNKFKKVKYDPLGPVFDILNWRFLKNGKYIQGRDIVEGVYLISRQAIFLPHIVIEDIHSINRENGPDEKVEQFYIGYGGVWPNICFKCWGKGKLDWLQKATGVLGPIPNVEFIRDRTTILIYPGDDNIIFGRPVLEEGESYCEACRGTGVEVNARYNMFKGMLGIRKKLKPVVTKIEL